MVQTIRPERREGDRRAPDRRGDGRRALGAASTEMDGVLYRLGRLQRVLVDVGSQVRELRTYAGESRPEPGELDDAAIEQIVRRLDAVAGALDSMRDDFDVARDAVEHALTDGS